MEQRTLKAAYKFYCNKEIINAHSAEADIKATYEVLLAQLEKYQNTEYEDKQGNKSIPVKNDVDSLHVFTNINKVVDFAGRMVYNDKGEEVINFGKHKGKTVEQIFDTEPSYYAWMKQGDFPLYTLKKLDEIWARWNKKKDEIRYAKKLQNESPKPPISNKSVEKQVKPQQIQNKPQVEPKKPKEAVAVTTDMLEQLKMKFGK